MKKIFFFGLLLFVTSFCYAEDKRVFYIPNPNYKPMYIEQCDGDVCVQVKNPKYIPYFKYSLDGEEITEDEYNAIEDEEIKSTVVIEKNENYIYPIIRNTYYIEEI